MSSGTTNHDPAGSGAAGPAPMAGLRVVDFTHVLAGPACGHFLALLGADVVKVESIGRGDAMRHRGGTDAARARDAMSTAYLAQGSAKRSIALDVGSRGGSDVMRRLLASADVLVENHLPATLDALGLGPDVLRDAAPRLVHCAMTGYGRGPGRDPALADAPAYDVNVQASSGLMSLTGDADTGPTRCGAPVMDYATALAAAFAVSAALLERERTGIARAVDVSMLETAHVLMASTVTDHLVTGREPRARGNAANSGSPSAGSFACRAGLLSLGVNEQRQFEALARVLDRTAWLDDARFAARAARDAHARELREALLEALAARDAGEWETLMRGAGVPAAKVRTLPESLAQHADGDDGFVRTDPADGAARTTLPFTLDGARPRGAARPAPRLGEHTGAVLGELGYAPDEIRDLRDAGAVG